MDQHIETCHLHRIVQCHCNMIRFILYLPFFDGSSRAMEVPEICGCLVFFCETEGAPDTGGERGVSLTADTLRDSEKKRNNRAI